MATALKRIMDGAGKGSIFGNGRFIGVHNPLGSQLGKAKDPYINLVTLARLSYSEDPQVRKAVIENIARRLQGNIYQEEMAYIISRFKETTVVKAFTQEKYDNYFVHQAAMSMLCRLTEEGMKRPFVRSMLVAFTMYPERCAYNYDGHQTSAVSHVASSAYWKLESLGMKPSDFELMFYLGAEEKILKLAVTNPRISRKILLELANYKSKNVVEGTFKPDERLNIEAFKALEPELTEEEMEVLAQKSSPSVMKMVLEHPKASPRAIAEIVMCTTPTTKEVFDSGKSWEATGPSHFEYADRDFRLAMNMIISRKEMIPHIISLIADQDDVLAAGITQMLLLSSVGTQNHGLAIKLFNRLPMEMQAEAIAKHTSARMADIDELIQKEMPTRISLDASRLWREMDHSDIADDEAAKIMKLYPELQHVADRIADHFRSCHVFWVANFYACDEDGQLNRTAMERSRNNRLGRALRGLIDDMSGMTGLGDRILAYVNFLYSMAD